MKRFWCSWYQPGEDYRPLKWPVSKEILGYWCSGHSSGWNEKDEEVLLNTMCSLLETETEKKAAELIKTHWPEFTGNWRFIEEKPLDYLPSDRFPMNLKEQPNETVL